MKQNLHQRVTAGFLALTLMLGGFPAALAAEAGNGFQETPETVTDRPNTPNQADVVADWKFGEAFTSGSIAKGDLIIEDQSDNNNDLKMQVYKDGNQEPYISFSEESMTGEGGSMVFNGDTNSKTGVDFITVDDAPINSEKFENGYTMEFLYYFPEDWTADDKWMGLIARQTPNPDKINSMDEPELGTMSVAISNCKEVQFLTAPAADDHEMESAAWSVSMDEGGVWYHIAIISDGHRISTYVNGCEAFRDYVSDEMVGMYADPEDGRFRVGSSWWNGLDKFLQGSLQEVRISGEPLEKEQWLVPNPEEYVDSFGSNEEYQLKNPDNYNIVLLPDTQNTVEFRPDVMNAAIDGLIDSADELNVAGVVHLGDVVDDNDNDEQYLSARESFYRLPDAGIKFLVQMGNHDGGDGTYNYANSFSGKSSEWTGRTGWYLTQSPNGGQNSSYMFLQAGSYNYLVISLSCAGSPSGSNGNTGWDSADEDWLRSVLEQYPNCPTIVTTHDLQNCSDTEPSAIKLSSRGNKLWNIVKDYDQVFMLVGGHSHGSGVQELTNDNGKQVISILTDLQFGYNGGNGWFRYLEFDESADKIYYSIYSPYAASLDEDEKSFFDVNFLTGKGNEGEISIDFEERFDGMASEEQAPEAQTAGMENGSASLDLTKIAGYSAGQFDVDGGVMEIVAYNSANGYAYAVNGKSGKLAVIPMKDLKNTGAVSALTGISFDVKAAVQAKDDSFTYGDMTSVAVSPDGKTLAAALQAENYADNGRVALFTCAKNGSLTLDNVVAVGVQPDMVTFVDDNTVLTADEGEPRQGYSAADPKGSVSVVDVKSGSAAVVDFTAFDSLRDRLTANGIVLKKNAAPSVDLEPEYIAVSGGKAYVTLQENNAIAVLDLASKTFTGIYSAGFEDHSKTPVDIDKKDEKYAPKTYGSLLGIRMPDGIAAFEQNGKTYLLTANEGDSREWGEYVNEDERNFGKDKTSPTGAITAENSGLTGKVVFFDAADYDGLDSKKDYLFGGRSFTLYEVSDTGIQEVFTSGSDFERLTARYLPKYFNCSNDDKSLDDRSGKKGPEAESVTVGQVNGKTYAFVALERIGGIMVYDVTDPAHVAYVNYINSRDFSSVIPGSEDDDKLVTGGDVAPEGLAFVPAAASPTGKDLLLAACEVSGTMAVYELTGAQPEGESGSGSSGGGSSSSGSSGSSTTETEKNPDGSTTTTVTDKKTGTVTETTKFKDGSTLVVETKKDGTVTTTETAKNGVKVETVDEPGEDVTAKVTIPKSVGEAVVTIPADVDYGTVAVDAKTGEVVKLSVPTKNGMTVKLDGSAELVLVDRSRDFTDTKGHWAENAIDFATAHELFAGTSDTTFTPDSPMTRAMLMTVLARFDGQDTTGGAVWYEKAMAWAKENGISDGSNPDGSITREQLATMLWRYAGSPTGDGSLSSFGDSASVNGYAVEAMRWAVGEGLISGTDAGLLAPQGNATRAQVATILMRFVESLTK